MSNKTVQTKFSADDRQQIQAAEKLATIAHRKQRRKSGEPYVIHPIAVAQSLVQWGMDAPTIVAGLLHDTVEDTDVTLDDIQQQFGLKVAELVDGVTKLGQVDASTEAWSGHRGAVSIENIRKLLLAMTKDLRVIVIKLADTVHNLQTLKYLAPENQQRFAAEALEIYAPLADRLGMGQVKSQIEDLAFRYAQPEEFQRVEQLMKGYQRKSSRYIGRLERFISAELKSAGVKLVSIAGRQKHLYSVYKKLAKAEGDFDKIYDLIAIRIIVPDEADCYRTMGILHQHFKPLIYRIKDYIAVPKPNGYRSLHTTVFALDGRITEFQIRTPQMHEEAERGLAAHFFYDTQKGTKDYLRGQVKSLPSKFTWVSSLADLQAVTVNGQEFIEALKIDLFQDRIFVFSPKGDLYDLPEGSTPIDFAFAVHSDIGLKVHGAKVNGRISPLDAKLENRDVVEVMTRRVAAPNRDWLASVKTPQARNRIRAWFRAASHDTNVASGRQALELEIKAWGFKRVEDLDERLVREAIDQLHFKDLEALLAAIGEGGIGTTNVVRRLFPQSVARPADHPVVKRAVATGHVVMPADVDLPYLLAPCCHPVFPQPIIGYITRGSGVTIHLQICRNLPDEPDRLLPVGWETEGTPGEKLLIALEIVGLNRVGLLHDVTGAISRQGINISGISSKERENGTETLVRLRVEVDDLYGLAKIIKAIERLAEVVSVQTLPTEAAQAFERAE